jgi:hypothetical protein
MAQTSAQTGVQGVAQPVAQQVHRQRDQHQHHAREDGDPPLAGEQEVVADADQRAQRRLVGGTPTPRKDSVASVMMAAPPGWWPAPAPAPARWAAHGGMMRKGARRSPAPPARIPCCAPPAWSRAPCARTAPSRSARWPGSAPQRPARRGVVGEHRPATPSISSAIRMEGKDSITSHTRMMKASTRRRRSPPAGPGRRRPPPTAAPTRPGPRTARCARRTSAPRGCRGPGRRCRAGRRLPPSSQAGGRRASIRFSDGQVEGVVRRHPGREQRADDGRPPQWRRQHGHRRAAKLYQTSPSRSAASARRHAVGALVSQWPGGARCAGAGRPRSTAGRPPG